jgi:ADP-L-glycero-D-manno-heptose 6-epimerase
VSALDGRILVTGGAGFIGSAVVWALNRRGRSDIVVTDFLDPSKRWRGSVPLGADVETKRKNLEPLRFSDFVEADSFRSRIASDPGAFGAFSTVFHLGACSSTTEMNTAYLEDVNFEYTRLLAGWALSRGTRFIYASSAATYGDGSEGMDDKASDIARLQPLNPYGRSKQDFDVHARDQGWLSRIVGLKYFNVFGPNEDHKGEMRSIVCKGFRQIQATGRVQLFKSYRPDFRDGGQKRDFLYVKDAVEMTLHFADAAPSAAGLFNIGSGQAHTWLELVNPIFSAMNLAPRIDFIDMPDVLRDKYQYFTQADISKLRAAGFTRPLTPLTDAVGDYVLNHLVPDKRLGA